MVNLTEIKWSGSRVFPKDRNKVAGVCETGREGNLLDLHVRVSQQQFLGFVDPVAGQIFIDRNTQEFAEQSGEILRSDKNLAAQFLNSQFLRISGFDFPYSGGNISLIQRIGGQISGRSVQSKSTQQVIAERRENFHVRNGFLEFRNGVRNDVLDQTSLLLTDKNNRLILKDRRDPGKRVCR